MTVALRPDVPIRPARDSDAPSMCRIYNESVADGRSNCDLAGLSVEEVAALLLGPPGRYPIWVLEVSGGSVGWARLSPFVEKQCFNYSAYSSTYISKASQGQGLGRLLRKWVLAEARRLGFKTIVNRIFVANAESIRLTESLGFYRAGHLRDVVWQYGEYWDVYLYQKILGPEDDYDSAFETSRRRSRIRSRVR